MIWDPLERLLWGIAITLLIFCGIFYFRKGRQNENVKDKILFYGFTFFFICLAISRFFEYLSDFFIIGSFKNFTFYGDYDNIDPQYNLFYKLSEIVFEIQFIILFLAFEVNIKRTKGIITIIQIILVSLLIIVPVDSKMFYTVIAVTFIYSCTVTLFVLFFFTKASKLEFKAIGAFLILSAMLFGISEILSFWQIKELNTVPLIISPLFYILGAFIGMFPITSNPERFSRFIHYWDFSSIVNIIIVVILEIFFISTGFPLSFIFGLNWFFLLIVVLQYHIIKDIKSQKVGIMKQDSLDISPNILEMFTKPQKITEEEVSVSKERRICLVCKGKLARQMYICPYCGSFYCKKCSNTLTNLENACWVCNAPFDESKPVKVTTEPEKLDVEIEKIDFKANKKNKQ